MKTAWQLLAREKIVLGWPRGQFLSDDLAYLTSCPVLRNFFNQSEPAAESSVGGHAAYSARSLGQIASDKDPTSVPFSCWHRRHFMLTLQRNGPGAPPGRR